MKQTNRSHDQSSPPVGTARSIAVAAANQSESAFVASADEVARRAYFSYLNEGARSGHDVQHWLEAEAELNAERKLTRGHGFPHHGSHV